MATLVQTVHGDTTGATSLTITITASGSGNLLLVSFNAYKTTVSSVVDSAGNTWTQDWYATHSSINAYGYHLPTTSNAGGITSVTITIAASADLAASVDEWSGVTSTTNGTAPSGTGDAATASSGSLTTTNANNLLWGAIGTDVETVSAVATGWTSEGTVTTNNVAITAAYQVVSATGSYTLSGTLSSSGIYAVDFVAFELASTGTQYTQAVTGSLLSNGTMVRLVRASLAGSQLASGNTTKRIGFNFAGISKVSGAVSRAISALLPEGSLVSAGALGASLLYSLALGGILAASGAIRKGVDQITSGHLLASGSVTKRISSITAGAIRASGSMTKRIAATLAGNSLLSGALNAAKSGAYYVVLTANLISSGTIEKAIAARFSAPLRATGSITKHFARSLPGASLLVSGVQSRQVHKVASGLAKSSGTITRSIGNALHASVVIRGNATRRIARIFTSQAIFTGAVNKRLSVNMKGYIKPVGLVGKRIAKLPFVAALIATANLMPQYIKGTYTYQAGSVVTTITLNPAVVTTINVVINTAITLTNTVNTSIQIVVRTTLSLASWVRTLIGLP